MAYATAYAMLHDAGLAQDAAQEALIDAYLSLANLREPAAFPGWFRRIIVKHADRQSRRRAETVPLEAFGDLRSPLPTPDVALEAALHREDVETLFSGQTPLHLAVHRNNTLYWGDYTVGYEPPPLAGLDAALAMDRWRADHFLHPAIDPLRSRSVLLETGAMGDDQCRLVADLKRHFVRYAELDRMVEKFGEDGLAILSDPHALQDVRRVRRIHRFLTQPLPGLEFLNGLLGVQVNLADTIAGCRAILTGAVDDLPEEAFYMAGTLEQVKAAKLQ